MHSKFAESSNMTEHLKKIEISVLGIKKLRILLLIPNFWKKA
jgi:hypothetical protein